MNTVVNVGVWLILCCHHRETIPTTSAAMQLKLPYETSDLQFWPVSELHLKLLDHRDHPDWFYEHVLNIDCKYYFQQC